MFYILYDDYTIVAEENFNTAMEYLVSGMKLYGYTDDGDCKNLMVYECFQLNS